MNCNLLILGFSDGSLVMICLRGISLIQPKGVNDNLDSLISQAKQKEMNSTRLMNLAGVQMKSKLRIEVCGFE